MKKLIKRPVGHPIVHGARSPKAIMSHASTLERRLYKDIYKLELHLTETDRIMVQGLAQHLAMIKLYWKQFNEVGISKDGRLTDAHRVFYTCWKNVIKLCNDLGLSTATKVKLGIDWKKFQSSGILEKYGED